MFGIIKILWKSEYLEMKKIYDTYQEYSSEKESEIERLESDLRSLREQNGNLRMEVNKLQEQNNNYLREVKSLREFRRDTLEAMGQIDLAGFRLSYCTKKCKNCEHEQKDCKKYEFGTHQYCVIHK